MAVSYLDSSALVKAYVLEQGSDLVRRILTVDSICLCALSRVELASALRRRLREGNVVLADVDDILANYTNDSVDYVIVTLDKAVLDAAASLLRETSTPLRSLDAIHLAAARLALNQLSASEQDTRLVSADRRMLEAASALGLPTLNPEARDPSVDRR